MVQGVAAVVGAASVSGQASTADKRWDVIVAGAGTAGLPAAILAAERGLSVLLIERSSRVGGTLAHTSGQIAAAGTRFQKAKGIHDTPQAFFDDAMRLAEGTADPTLVRLYTRHAAEVVDWLQDNGFEILPGHPTATGYNGTFSAPRFMQGIDEGRSVIKAMLGPLRAATTRGGLTVIIRSGVAQLLTDRAGAVTGVICQDEDGRQSRHMARSVVLTAGGCAANPELYQSLHGVPLYGREAHQYNDGRGLQAAVAAGAAVRGGDKYLPYIGAVLTDVHYPSPRIAIASVDARFREPWEIFVNDRGERFMAEDDKPLRPRLMKLRAQPHHRYWIVFDEAIRAKAPPLLPDIAAQELPAFFAHHPSFATGQTLSELAEQMGVDPGGLLASVEGYNRSVAGERDPFGRQHSPLPIKSAPFYGVLHQGWSMVSYAGLTVNDGLQVLRQDGAPIANLYAAGEILGAAATTGQALSLGGNVTPALTFGYLLGTRILPA